VAQGSGHASGTRGYLLVAAAAGVANAAAYGLTALAARGLGPEQFGAFGALLAFVLVGNVAALAVQAVVARRRARHADLAPAVLAGLLVALAAAALIAAATPALTRYLRLPDPVGPLAVAVAVAALAAAAVPVGLSQGAERFGLLAVLVASQGLLRVVGGLVALVVNPTASSVLAGTAAGLVVAALVAWLAVRPPGPSIPGSRPVLREAAAAGGVLLGFVALTNVDVTLARHVLTPTESGWYAAGAIFTKVAFWLPQFVPLVAFPALSDPLRRRTVLRRALLAVAASGLALVVGSAVASDALVALVAGPAYAPMAPWLWGFTALGALFAVAQLLVYAQLAAGDHRTGAVVWVVLVALVLVVELTATGLAGVLVPALGAATVVTAWGVIREQARPAMAVPVS